MDQMEIAFYEAKPFLYLGLGVYVLSSQEPNPILIASALLLMFCAALIIRLRLKNRRGTPIERLVYKSQPWAYLAIGLCAIFYLKDSKVGLGSGLILLFISTIIVRWRYKGRPHTQNDKT